MSEMAELYRQMRLRRQRRRHELSEEAASRFEELSDLVTSLNSDLWLQRCTDTHYVIRNRDMRVPPILSWWPSGQKWQLLPHHPVKNGGIKKFIAYLEKTLP